MEKTLRVLSGGDEDSGHSHSHAHKTDHNITKAETTAVEASTSRDALRLRKDEVLKEEAEAPPESNPKSPGPSKLSAYLNLFGDFVHNMWVSRKASFKYQFAVNACSDTRGAPPSGSTDGLAYVIFLKPSADLRLIFGFWLSFDLNPIGDTCTHGRACYMWWWRFQCSMAASFYASPLIGATTTLACFAHEIPHEIADYSILIRSGFTKRQAMQSQFLTAIGAFVSCFYLSPFLWVLIFLHVLGWVRACCFGNLTHIGFLPYLRSCSDSWHVIARSSG